ncbi:MAG: DUF4352 domain-containing protein [Flavobacteriaceae bacterium]|nr:DUF4352 domain-containing protein [Flavobacteriaceae bacterium]
MKFIRTIALLILILVLNSCRTIYQVVEKDYGYNKSIEFTIDKIEDTKAIATGGGAYHPSSGSKFVIVYLTIKNNLNQKQDLNFDDFTLLEMENKIKHKVEWVMVPGIVNIWSKKNSYISKNGTKKRKIIFIFPENNKAKFMMVNGNIIEIKYSI